MWTVDYVNCSLCRLCLSIVNSERDYFFMVILVSFDIWFKYWRYFQILKDIQTVQMFLPWKLIFL